LFLCLHIDCAEHLVAEKWTSPDRLVIEGENAGGLLMGAVVNMRPDLFRAVHAGVPLTAFNDSQVRYWEPAGHGGTSGRYDRLKDTAFECAWMLK
jgi:protease II